jgi:hypothetical protein
MGISPKEIPKIIAGDVDVVEESASIVVGISSGNSGIEIRENPNSRLNVIAIVGPAQGFGRNWDKVLLAEIGISRNRPYMPSEGLDRGRGKAHLHRRRKWFSLSEDQYRMVAPIIFKLMNYRMANITSSWKFGSHANGYLLPARNHWWSRSRKRTIVKNFMLSAPRGIRFNVSLRDEFFVRDIFWAELNQNQRIKKQIEGLARWISLRLAYYNGDNYKGVRPVTGLVGYQEVLERIGSFYFGRFPHLRAELAKRLREDHRMQFFFVHLADILDWRGKETEERRLASLACSIPNPKERVDKIQILVTSDLSRGKNFITFEVQK